MVQCVQDWAKLCFDFTYPLYTHHRDLGIFHLQMIGSECLYSISYICRVSAGFAPVFPQVDVCHEVTTLLVDADSCVFKGVCKCIIKQSVFVIMVIISLIQNVHFSLIHLYVLLHLHLPSLLIFLSSSFDHHMVAQAVKI